MGTSCELTRFNAIFFEIGHGIEWDSNLLGVLQDSMELFGN